MGRKLQATAGVRRNWGQGLTGKVTTLQHRELVLLDSDRLDFLYKQLGSTQADLVLCDAMESLVRCLSWIERDRISGKVLRMISTAAELESVAARIGLPLLEKIARSVRLTAKHQDMPGMAAACARLSRVGNQSIAAFWNPHGLSG